MMFRNTKVLKSFSFFVLGNLLLNILLPVVSHAEVLATVQTQHQQDNDPTTPEMVDLRSGDFHYEVPVMEVPGPDGGYNIELDYNSGILSDQDASWVGLGWNLGAGSISRTLNGFADDYDNRGVYTYDSWSGTGVQPYQLWMPLTTNQATSSNTQGWSSGSTPYYGILNAYDATYGTDPYAKYNKSMDVALMSDLSGPDSLYYKTTNGNPMCMPGGVAPAYDNYVLTGPGISGEIEPVVLDNGSLFSLSVLYQAEYDVLKKFTKHKQQFRFKDDYSNSFKVNPAFIDQFGDYTFGSNNLAYTYSGPRDNSIDTSTMRLASGKEINYFTNAEITSLTAKAQGFIDYPGTVQRSAISYMSGTDITAQIGGYSVTKEDGTTYHYALPAYDYSLNTTLAASGVISGRTSSIISSFQPYAYTWLLTTITGNDFVDKNGNGIADEEDAGAWTNFNYGLWKGDYYYSYPYKGSIKVMDDSQYSSTVKKEVYYLDAVYTRSHTALLLKTARTDGYGSSDSTLRRGVLGLKSVNLYRNEDVMNMSATSTNTFTKSIFNSIQQIKQISTQKYSYTDYTNLLDYNDIYTGTGMATNFTVHNPLKRVELVCDYTLANQSPNTTYLGTPSTGKWTLKSVKFYGRSEVKEKPSVDFQYELPVPKTFATTLIYIPSDLSTTRTGRIDMGTTPNPFQPGDIVQMTIAGTTYYGTLVRGIVYAPNGSHVSRYDIHFLGSAIPDATKKSISVTATQTKNPPYTANHRDNWGYFKSDYRDSSLSPLVLPTGAENSDRRTSTISGQSIDVWSLRRITTSLGATIDVEYESDMHSNPTNIYNKGKTNPRGLLNVNTIGHSEHSVDSLIHSNKFSVNALDRSGTYEFTFKEPINYSEEFYVGQVINIQTLATFSQNGGTPNPDIKWPNSYTGSDLFQVTYVENSPSPRIKGVFVPDQLNSPKQNPLAATKYSDSGHDLWLAHNGSYVMYEPKQKCGGGVRTKRITVTENTSSEFFVDDYSYTNKSTGYSSGMTASEPLTFAGVSVLNTGTGIGTDSTPVTVSTSPYYHNYNYGNNFQKCRLNYYTKNLYTGFYNVLSTNYSNNGVVYEYVTRKHTGNGSLAPTYNEYKYKVFSDDLIVKTILNDSPPTLNYFGRTIKIINKTSCVGNLLRVKSFDQQNDLIKETNYNYASTDQGTVEQVFHESRDITPVSGGPDYFVNIVTVLSKQMSVLSDIETKDHVKGPSSFIHFKTYDFLSGQPLQLETNDSYGNTLISTSHPAFHLYTDLVSSGAQMGSKIKNTNNRHMLSPIAAKYTTKQGSTTSIGFTLSTVSTATGSTQTRYKATLSSGKTLPFSYTPNSYFSMNYTSGGFVLSAGYISYIYPDRKSFEFYFDDATIGGASGNVTNVNTATPLSASIQPWSNSWSYRNYNATTSLFENLAIVESSPVNYFDYQKIWRPAAPYIWNSPFIATDGSYLATGTGAYQEFDWSLQLAGTAQSSALWQQLSAPTLKDKYSSSVEGKDVNGNYAATKIAYDQSFVLTNTGGYTYTYSNALYNNYVLSSGKNTNVASFGYSGFEEISKPSGASSNQYGGEIQGNASGSQYATTSIVKPHTGNYSLKVSASTTVNPFTAYYKTANAEGNIIRGKKYRASVWVHNTSSNNASINYSIIGNSGAINSGVISVAKSAATITVGNWSLLTINFDVPATYTSVASTDLIQVTLSGGTANSYFDDFAVRPIDADQISYVYDPLTKQVLATLDENNFYTRFEYDNTGRMTASYVETLNGEKKVSTQDYNFAKP